MNSFIVCPFCQVCIMIPVSDSHQIRIWWPLVWRTMLCVIHDSFFQFRFFWLVSFVWNFINPFCVWTMDIYHSSALKYLRPIASMLSWDPWLLMSELASVDWISLHYYPVLFVCVQFKLSVFMIAYWPMLVAWNIQPRAPHHSLYPMQEAASYSNFRSLELFTSVFRREKKNRVVDGFEAYPDPFMSGFNYTAA